MPALVCLGLFLAFCGLICFLRLGGKPSGWAGALLFLIVVYVVVEVISLRCLGTNANNTFQTAPPQAGPRQ
jgi:hypothetical protein